MEGLHRARLKAIGAGGGLIGICSQNVVFLYLCAETMFLARLFEDPSCTKCSKYVPTQLSGRGFRYICVYEIVCVATLRFWHSKMEVGPCSSNT